MIEYGLMSMKRGIHSLLCDIILVISTTPPPAVLVVHDAAKSVAQHCRSCFISVIIPQAEIPITTTQDLCYNVHLHMANELAYVYAGPSYESTNCPDNLQHGPP